MLRLCSSAWFSDCTRPVSDSAIDLRIAGPRTGYSAQQSLAVSLHQGEQRPFHHRHQRLRERGIGLLITSAIAVGNTRPTSTAEKLSRPDVPGIRRSSLLPAPAARPGSSNWLSGAAALPGLLTHHGSAAGGSPTARAATSVSSVASVDRVYRCAALSTL